MPARVDVDDIRAGGPAGGSEAHLVRTGAEIQFVQVGNRLSENIESDSERIPRGLPRGMRRALTRGKRANINVFFPADRRFPAASGGELQWPL